MRDVMKKIVALIILFTSCATADAQKFETVGDYRMISERIDDIYIPANIDEAMVELDGEILSYEDREYLMSLSEEEFLCDTHHTLGAYLRNAWGLWFNSRLAQHLRALGISHPDDMSAYILATYYCHWHNLELPEIKGNYDYCATGMKPVKCTERWRQSRYAARDMREFRRDECLKRGDELVYCYPYGFSTLEELKLYEDGDDISKVARGKIKKFDAKQSRILVEVTYTPEPYGVIVFNGNCYINDVGDIYPYEEDSKTIFYLREGDILWFNIGEIFDFWDYPSFW